MLKKSAHSRRQVEGGFCLVLTTLVERLTAPHLRGRGILFLVITALSFPVFPAQGQDKSHQVKAVYLYNFGNYVTWPAQPTEARKKPREFVIGILATRHPVEAVLKKIARKKTIHGAKIRTLMIDDVSANWDCQILYIPESTHPDVMKQAIKAVKEKPVLVVGELPDFATLGGGMIRFYQAQTMIRFEINPLAIRKARMKASSKLIQIGHAVSDSDPGTTD